MNVTALISDGARGPKSPLARARSFDIGKPRAAVPWREAGFSRDAVVKTFERLDLTPTALPPRDEPNVDFSDLVERIAARADREAFACLFAFYAPRVKGYLLRLGLDAGRAEDLSQDVMVAVWRKAATFDRRQASVATWIYRIARNRRIDVFRRERRANLDAHDPAFEPQAEIAPDGAVEAADREVQIRRAMADLPPEQLELVREAFYEDLSHSQIAEKTGVPLGTVKSRLRLAFAKLKLRIESDEVDPADGGRS